MNRNWKDLPYNGQEGQPCPYGCILQQNGAGKYRLVGDCRIPWSNECCMNKQKEKKRAKEIAEEKKLTRLQQELYDLIESFVYNDEDTYNACMKSYTSWEAYCEDLKRDIKTMNAAELRRNIKLWKEDISFGRK